MDLELTLFTLIFLVIIQIDPVTPIAIVFKWLTIAKNFASVVQTVKIGFQVHMCKLQNFSVTQILREIKVGKSGASKIVILTDLEALNFDTCAFFTL